MMVNWQGLGLLTCVLPLSRCGHWVGVYAIFMVFAFIVRVCLLAVEVATRGGQRGQCLWVGFVGRWLFTFAPSGGVLVSRAVSMPL